MKPETSTILSCPGEHILSSNRTVPSFPRLVERVPVLELLSDVLPAHSPADENTSMTSDEIENDRFEWTMRKRAMKQAIQVLYGNASREVGPRDIIARVSTW